MKKSKLKHKFMFYDYIFVMNEAILGFWTLIKWFRSCWMATICCLKTIYTVGFRGALRHASLPLPLSDWKIGDWHLPLLLSGCQLDLATFFYPSQFFVAHKQVVLTESSTATYCYHDYHTQCGRSPSDFLAIFCTTMCQKYSGFTLLDSNETKPLGSRFRMNCTFDNQ